MQKRVLAIHDISCIGRCSLTAVLPILSVAGLETCVLPTAVLSTQTGGMSGFTFHDLTDEIIPITEHWKNLGQSFDVIYSGYLGSLAQANLVETIIRDFKKNDSLVVVDPVMADHGEYYSMMTPEFADKMRLLAKNADIITPNLTEAAFLLKKPYNPYPDEKEVAELLHGLCKLGAKKIVITGVSFEKSALGAAAYDSETDEISYAFTNRINGIFHGTGDIFCSTLTAAVTRGKTLAEAARIAMEFTYRSICRTLKAGTDLRFGVQFEPELVSLIDKLKS